MSTINIELSGSLDYYDYELVEIINDEYGTNYSSISDIDENLLKDYFIMSCNNYIDTVKIGKNE